MLHLETVESGTFSILKELMQLPAMRQFYLVGGTALSLKYGHRISVDLDLFTTAPFENEIIQEALNGFYQSNFIIEGRPARFGIFAYIKDIKTDIVHHPHPLIRPSEEIGGIRMFSIADIMAMKIQAILGRAKKKDFWDIAELLMHYSVQDFINFHKEKYSTQNLLITVPQAMTYFADAEESEDPISLKGQTWERVKHLIQIKVSEYLL
jgi:predicted nucleotidyltransferase component of viral defense system